MGMPPLSPADRSSIGRFSVGEGEACITYDGAYLQTASNKFLRSELRQQPGVDQLTGGCRIDHEESAVATEHTVPQLWH